MPGGSEGTSARSAGNRFGVGGDVIAQQWLGFSLRSLSLGLSNKTPVFEPRGAYVHVTADSFGQFGASVHGVDATSVNPIG